ncbi:MAG TPA: hypothetical protein VHQ03_01290, partial [Candidatus Dormibacteraeota bacterium]|nr:hypothetical protein [Candidatus Dormibacteraeota bacterium]
MLGAYVPQLGWLSVAGATAVPVFTLWFCVLALVSGVPSVLAIRLGLVAGAAPAAVSLLACAGSVVILVSLLQLGNADLFASLGFTGLGAGRPDETYVYSSEGDIPLRIDVYRPRPASGSGGAPVLLYVHGG